MLRSAADVQRTAMVDRGLAKREQEYNLDRLGAEDNCTDSWLMGSCFNWQRLSLKVRMKSNVLARFR
jgi:hypothetical protein